MPVTFAVDPSKKPQRPLSELLKSHVKTSVKDYIDKACPNQAVICQEVLQASFGDAVRGKSEQGGGNLEQMTKIRKGGLVDVAVEAYNRHYHLVLRPDDVWIAILSQLSFYINAHAEELRSTFVSHEGKKELVIEAFGDRYSVDFAKMAHEMTRKLHENIKDEEVCGWIMAQFSTTTDVDRTIYAIEMMATMKKYFSYSFSLMCGLPNVTLEGSKHDWENIYARIDKLETFGAETKHWASMLRVIVSRFIKSFDVFDESSKSTEEEKNDLKKFWNTIAHHSGGGSGPTYLSGWITAFCPWNSDGEWLDDSCAPGKKIPEVSEEKKHLEIMYGGPSVLREYGKALVLDDTMFPIVDTDKVPNGYVEVDVKLDDNGEQFDTVMLAGHMGGKVLETQEKGKEDKLALASGWVMFIKDKAKEEALNKSNEERGKRF